MNLINTTEELETACKILKKQKVIAIDCEFIREKTYFPIPCLIQIACNERAFLLDPLAKKMDMSAFFDIMQNKKILKVFHSGRQDIEIIYNLSGQIPTSVFDTQIAAQACGLGESVSYENLVRVCCGIELDKSCRLTNWQLRPLTEEQLEYAAGDVTHLITCYEKIISQLKEQGREKWIAEDMKDLVDIKHYEIHPEEAWLKIRHNGHSLSFLNALKELAAWRENRAVRQNITRQNVIKDDVLINIATAFPKTLEEMKLVRGIHADTAKSILAREMLEVLNNLTPDKYDKALHKINRDRDVVLPPSLQSLCEILKLLLKIKCNEQGIALRLVTNEKNLREYIKNPKAKNQILTGWRYDVFGKTAEEFRQGRLGITYDPQKRDITIKELS